jgi:predicted short-subunit dehydrogenase-like oxidoreductase (DUF2520 family)
MRKDIKITILGLGNVGFQLAKALVANKFTIHQVYNRTKENAFEFVQFINSELITDVNLLDTGADVFLFCLKDSVITEVLEKTHFTNQLLIHTAGSVDIDVFKGKSDNYGVLYPLQTFSKERDIEFKNIPICIEGNSEKSETKIRQIAEKLSSKVYEINSNQRIHIHLAAVFASNYSNYMYCLAQEILEEQNVDFDIIRPLIKETANKAIEFQPMSVQTGPAIRNDDEIIQKHLSLLQSEDKKKIYNLIAEYIKNKKR